MLLLTAMAIAFVTSDAFAQDILLPAPVKSGGKPIAEVFASRKSERQFDPAKEISIQTLSNLLWSACGINREDGKLTAPTALNKQEINVYVFNKDGVYLYDSHDHSLKLISKGDNRALVAGRQDFVKAAPVSLVIVADIAKFGDLSDRSKMMAAVDTGIVCQNINLFCSGNDLATVPRASMETEAISRLLGLKENSIPIMNNPVGYR